MQCSDRSTGASKAFVEGHCFDAALLDVFNATPQFLTPPGVDLFLRGLGVAGIQRFNTAMDQCGELALIQREHGLFDLSSVH